jgi:hypothetical protein
VARVSFRKLARSMIVISPKARTGAIPPVGEANRRSDVVGADYSNWISQPAVGDRLGDH